MRSSWLAVLAVVQIGSTETVKPSQADLCSDLVLAIDATSRDLAPLRQSYDAEFDHYSTTLRLLPAREADSCVITQLFEDEPFYLACTEKVMATDVETIRTRAKEVAEQVTTCLRTKQRRFRIWKDWTAIAPGDSGNSYWRIDGGARMALLVDPPRGGGDVIVEIQGECRETVKRKETSCFLTLTSSHREPGDKPT